MTVQGVKKALLIISGILKCLMSGLLIVCGGLLFLLNGTFKAVFNDETVLKNMVNEMVKSDAERYSFLKSYTLEQVLDYIMQMVSNIGIAFLVLGAFILLFAILTFRIVKHGCYLPKGKRILFLVCMLVCTLFISFSNLFTIIALSIGNQDKNKGKNVVLENDIPIHEIS